MKIAFVWDWDNELLQIVSWFDGLAGALRELSKKADVKIYTQVRGVSRETLLPHPYFDVWAYADHKQMTAKVEEDKPDVVLFWADFTRPAITELYRKFPSAICYSGGNTRAPVAHFFGKIFVESKVYMDQLIEDDIDPEKVVQAFGTNTEVFAPQESIKMFDVFFPATFADWKRHHLFADAARGMSAFACGWYQEHEPWCYEACKQAGILTTQHTLPHNLVDFYAASHCVCVTSESVGGSQRTVLEAMAMNVPVIVMADSDKCSEYLYDSGNPDMVVAPDPQEIRRAIQGCEDLVVDTRPWILNNFSEHIYADKLYKGLCELN